MVKIEHTENSLISEVIYFSELKLGSNHET